MISYQEPDVLFTCGTFVRFFERVCVRVLDVLLDDLYGTVTTAGSDGVAGASHSRQLVEQSSAQRKEKHHGLQSHSVPPACDVSNLAVQPFVTESCGETWIATNSRPELRR